MDWGTNHCIVFGSPLHTFSLFQLTKSNKSTGSSGQSSSQRYLISSHLLLVFFDLLIDHATFTHQSILFSIPRCEGGKNNFRQGINSDRLEKLGQCKKSESENMGRAGALLIVLCCYCVYGASSSFVQRVTVPKLSKGLTQNLKSLSFDEAYLSLFGENNLQLAHDGQAVKLQLNRHSGSGIISQDLYNYGFFSASMKLPEDYTAGVVTAFYTSNSDNFEHNHDELDFEFLGNIRGKEWRIQTNLYGNGSTDFGREERYKLWFDPTEDFHQYSIVWTDKRIIFFVDDVPIREVVKTESMGAQYPSKPMSVYATIWDGSEWATAGGRYKVNYKYGPFTMELQNLILEGCAVDPILVKDETQSRCGEEEEDIEKLSELSDEQRLAMEWFRSKYIYYSYCDDSVRYPTELSECPKRDPHKPIATAHLYFGHHHHHRNTHRRKRSRLHHSAASASASV